MLGFMRSVGSHPRKNSVPFIDGVAKTVWFSAIDSAITQSAGKVTAIADLSGNGNDLALSSGGTNECTYDSAHAGAHGKPAFVFADTSNDTHFRVPGNVTLQDIFVVCRYRAGTETTFAGNESILGGSGSFGAKRITGNAALNDWISSNHFTDLSSKNGATATGAPLPMNFDVYRFTAAAPETDQFYFFGGNSTPVAWRGLICEIIGLPATADGATASGINDYLAEKYDIPRHTLNALFVGQSLMNRGFTLFSGAGKTAFIAEAKALGFITVNALNGAKDSAAVRYEADSGSGAYLDASNTGEGAVFTANLVPAVTGAASLGVGWEDIDVVFHMIGNTDRLAVQNALITEGQHKSGYKTLIDLVKARAPNAIHISLPNIGETALTTTDQHNAWTAIKRAQYQLTQEQAYILESCGLYDITRADSQHPDQAGYELEFRRCARLAAYYLGIGSPNNPLGAEITGATYNAAADSVTVTVAHNGGTDFTIADPDGFWITINGTKYQATSVTRNSATTFTLSG